MKTPIKCYIIKGFYCTSLIVDSRFVRLLEKFVAGKIEECVPGVLDYIAVAPSRTLTTFWLTAIINSDSSPRS